MREKLKEAAARVRKVVTGTPKAGEPGTGAAGPRLEERTVAELRSRAAELEIRGRSRMKKAELVEAIRTRNG